MDLKNYIEKLFIGSINIMKTNEWEWPAEWESSRKLQFLNEALNYAKQNEFWEQAAIIRDVTETIKKETGSVSGNPE